MAIFGPIGQFLHQRKPRGFNYRPRFYDPEAEARESHKRVVLGEKYRSPEQLRREEEAIAAGKDPGAAAAEYVPGAYLREHVAARRGHVADVMRKRRRKLPGLPILVALLAALLAVAWIFYLR
jgi:hypothetical protein